ncbi:MAG TPA: ribosome assembly cofactor RimP [Eudoraea sp.]|nr:ribosome assembly cofactor RimP [Eudoraea sp.]
MLKDKVEKLLHGALSAEESLFLIDFSVSTDHKIRIVLDGDRGVSLNDCMRISRAIEHQLDREEVDFSLEVTSAGATSPIVMPRQYHKNIGRVLKVTAGGNTFKGKLTQVLPEHIILEWKAREAKPVGKGKITVQNKQEIAISEIEEAKVVLKF